MMRQTLETFDKNHNINETPKECREIIVNLATLMAQTSGDEQRMALLSQIKLIHALADLFTRLSFRA